ncbi:MAG: sigma-54-dependent Fis family transcriptional regulator, partial [Deltaproteobacteria bacterium]|nr:sigma-54-dependent Fis family transcriptional regulator [Deltaproteobacteria bacterium]
LVQMPWPGNVRELENVIERAVLLCKRDHITRTDLFLEDIHQDDRAALVGFRGSLKEMEKKMIFQALDQTDGNRTHAADILGISVRTLRNKLNEYKRQMAVL